jgi:predicted dehydrogenase
MRIGLIGCGHLGKIHAKCIKEIDVFDLIGIFDISHQKVQETADQFGITPYFDLQALIDSCDLVDIVAATTAHYELAKQCIIARKHCFIEKPVTATVEEAEKLIELAEKYKVIVQVGHIERYNPAYLAALPYISQPFFINAHRSCRFNLRGSDVSVVHDIMIHDIDLVLSITQSKIIDIQANGYKWVTNSLDYADAKMIFENGVVAQLTASRVSSNILRKMCIFQSNNCISVDFQDKKAEIIMFERLNTITAEIPVIAHNAIIEELCDFIQSVQQKRTPKISLMDGNKALCIADKVITNILQQNQYNVK